MQDRWSGDDKPPLYIYSPGEKTVSQSICFAVYASIPPTGGQQCLCVCVNSSTTLVRTVCPMYSVCGPCLGKQSAYGISCSIECNVFNGVFTFLCFPTGPCCLRGGVWCSQRPPCRPAVPSLTAPPRSSPGTLNRPCHSTGDLLISPFLISAVQWMHVQNNQDLSTAMV